MRGDALAESSALARSHQELRAGLEAALTEFNARVTALSSRQEVLSQHVTLMQYGPGNPQTPCLAGEHLGFRLAHYHGHVYGLRKPLEIDQLANGEQELLAGHGPEDIIVGETLDGVRARIELVEGLRDVRSSISAVDRELLAGDSRVAEGLRQMDTMVQAHSVQLENLARHWTHRIFKH
jgi:hypothetical protein